MPQAAGNLKLQRGKHVLGNVKARHASSDRTKQIGSYGADSAGHAVREQGVLAGSAIDGDFVADGDARHVGRIDHRHVHGDDAHYWRDRSANKNVSFVAKRAMNAVAIAGGEQSNPGRPRRNELRIVSHALPSRNIAKTDDARAQTHDRFQRQLALRLFTQLRRIVAWMIAVQDRSGPDHVRPGLRTRSDRGAVREMYDAGIDAELFEPIQRGVEPFFLLARLAHGNRIQKYSRRSKMSEDAAQLQVLTFRKLRGEALGIIECDAQAVHAGVHFQ